LAAGTVLVALAWPNEGQTQDFSAPSVVRAEAEATLSSEIPGRIDSLPFKSGEAFARGEVLIEIDCARFASQAKTAHAESAGAAAVAASREALFAKGGIGQLEVDMAKAAAAAALARVETAELQVGYCEVRAPFDGFVTEHMLNAFEFVEPGEPVLSIVSSGDLDLEIIAPADWLTWVGPGTGGELRLDAIDQSFGITIRSLAPVVDPVSRTVKLRADFNGDTTGARPGMSGLVAMER
jgi:RND family efflux transporter MFP subunit